jgi:hypothetical protein
MFAVAAVVVMVFVAGAAQSPAQGCPPRPPGYWYAQRCTGTDMVVAGFSCLVEICFCVHYADPAVPGDLDEYYITSIRAMIPGCPLNPADFSMFAGARYKLAILHCRSALDENGEPQDEPFCAGFKDVKVSHALCYHNVGQGTNLVQQACANSGECSTTYRVICPDCRIVQELGSTSTGACDYSLPENSDCVIVCQ